MLDLGLQLDRVFDVFKRDAPNAVRTSRAEAAKAAMAGLAAAFLKAPPSTKIRYAMEDLEAAERSDKHDVEMQVWHAADARDRGGACRVCLAGAVLAARHPITPGQVYVGPFQADGRREYSAGRHWDNLFLALDQLRTGNVLEFLMIEGTATPAMIEACRNDTFLHGPSGLTSHHVAPHHISPHHVSPHHVSYDSDPDAFKQWARAVATRLAAHGC